MIAVKLSKHSMLPYKDFLCKAVLRWATYSPTSPNTVPEPQHGINSTDTKPSRPSYHFIIFNSLLAPVYSV